MQFSGSMGLYDAVLEFEMKGFEEIYGKLYSESGKVMKLMLKAARSKFFDLGAEKARFFLDEAYRMDYPPSEGDLDALANEFKSFEIDRGLLRGTVEFYQRLIRHNVDTYEEAVKAEFKDSNEFRAAYKPILDGYLGMLKSVGRIPQGMKDRIIELVNEAAEERIMYLFPE